MDIKELRETASLAKISMNDQEMQEIIPAFEQMIDYFGTMQDADKSLLVNAEKNDGSFIIIPNVL